jgi:hypothetical protein
MDGLSSPKGWPHLFCRTLSAGFATDFLFLGRHNRADTRPAPVRLAIEAGGPIKAGGMTRSSGGPSRMGRPRLTAVRQPDRNHEFSVTGSVLDLMDWSWAFLAPGSLLFSIFGRSVYWWWLIQGSFHSRIEPHPPESGRWPCGQSKRGPRQSHQIRSSAAFVLDLHKGRALYCLFACICRHRRTLVSIEQG